MKKLLLVFLCFLTIGARAQDTVKKSNSVGKFDEQFMVLKSDKKVRQGSYKLFIDKKLAAVGAYDKGKRTGIWNFYNDGELDQQYDYTLNKLVMNAGAKAITGEVNDAQPGDSVKNAVKIGGYNGLRLLIASTDFESNADVGNNKVIHVFSLDETGNIKAWTASVKSADGIKIINQKVGDIDPYILAFLPAMLNNKAVASTLTFNTEIKGVGGAGDDPGSTKAKMHGGGGRKGKN